MSKELRTYLHRRRQMLRILALGQHAEVSAGWRRGTSYWRNWRVEEHNRVDTVGIKDPEGNVDRKFCVNLAALPREPLMKILGRFSA